MPDTKPSFNPNEPYKAPESQSNSKPAFNPQADFKPAKPQYVPHIDDFNPTPTDNSDKIESAINFLANDPTTKGGMIDVDKDILRSVMKHPNVTQDQIKEAIGTMQSGNLYYLKNENGVMIPKQLKNGEKPPKGYNVQSVWGTQEDANDDSWYTDLGKSLYNGVIGAAKGMVDLAQAGTMLATGKESTYLNKLGNTAEALQAQKDIDLSKPIYNTEEVKEWSDLLDKDRFDLSPAALWGTINMAAESVTSFYGGAKAATTLAKLGPKASAYVGSYLTQLGDNLDNAKEAGLEGREASAFATLTTGIQAAIDAQFGLESKIYQGGLKKPAADLFKGIVATVPKGIDGKITQEGFKQLAREATEGYGKIAAIGAKAIGKDALTEGAQETGQDFVAKAAENLWDKMDINDRNKFGTNAASPESFASYIQNGLAGLVSGVPMAVASTNAKKKYDEQSVNAYKTVQKGPEAVNELKSNLAVAKEKGTISTPEYEQAIFKVDAYQKYDEQTKDLNLDDKEKKESFELSFNIEALKSEVDFKEDELKRLDPIALAKVDSKKKLIKGLQEELNKIILKEDIQKETKVGQDTVDKVAKDEEPVEDQAKLKDLLKKFGKPEPSPKTTTKTDVSVNKNVYVVPTSNFDSKEKDINVTKEIYDEWKKIDDSEREAKKSVDNYGLNEQEKSARKKAISMEYAAKKRALLGTETVKEKKIQEKESESVRTGDSVIVNGKIEKVIVSNFGKIKLTNGKSYTKDSAEIQELLKSKKKLLQSNLNKQPYKQYAYDRENTPHFDVKDDKGTYEFNKLTDPISKQRAIRNYLDEHPELNNEIDGTVYQSQNNVWQVDLGDGRFVQFARSIEPDKFTGSTENLPESRTEVKDSDGRPLYRYSDPVAVKLESITADDGSRKRILNIYNKNTGKYIVSVKEKQQGGSGYSKSEIKQMQDLQQNGYTSDQPDTKTKPVKLNPVDEETQEREFLQNRELSEEEIANELEKEVAREQEFFETGMFENEISNEAEFNNTELVKELKKLKRKGMAEVFAPLVNKITDKSVKATVDIMLKNAGKIDPFVRFEGFQKMNMGGLFYYTSGSIYLGNHLENEVDEQLFIKILAHEYMHAFTVKSIAKPKTEAEKQFYKDITKIYQEVKSSTNYSKEYGFTNIYEFVSELSTNSKFVKKIKDNNRTLFQKIIDAIKKLFGIKTNESLIEDGIKSILEFIPNSNPGKIYSAPNMSSDSFNENAGRARSYQEKDVNKLIKEILKEKNLNKFSNELLLEAHNAIMSTRLSDKKKKEYLGEVMKRIALNLKQNAINESGKTIDEDSVQKDISWIDKWFKVLSHFSDSFPEMKSFSKIWNSAYFNKMKEAKAEKRTHDKLAEAVIKDRNKKLGIKETTGRLLGQIISENRHNYFGFLDAGNGKLITLEEAKKKGLSKEQIDYLKYTREMLAARQKIDVDIYDADMDVLRTDKSFGEAFKTEGIISAVGSWLGSNSLSNIKLNFTDPNTGKSSEVDFIDIQKVLSTYADKGIKEKAIALASLIKYTLKAAKKRVKKGGEYLLDEDGNLQSKFNRPVDDRKSYSKDFYGALNQYIDDTAHIKHISPLVPIINSIEYLNSKDLFDSEGNKIGEEKKNLVEWIDKWRKLHVLGQSEETQPELDKALRLLRFMTSAVTMWFNVPANILNVVIGNYNTIRDQSFKEWALGQKRLFGGTDRKYGVLNRYAYELANKYITVSHDTDSNPIQTGSGLFAKLAYLGQSWGEFQIQTSGLFGLMDEKDFNSFEFKTNKHGVEELVVKEGIDEKALEERILANIDKVSDVQGKYGEKDKRNVMNNEIGKAALAYRVWIPDAWRVRYGSNGSWSKQLKGGFSEMRRQIKDKGFVNSLISGKDTEEVKDFKRNLKGLMATGLLISLTLTNDDDEEKTYASKLFQKALADVLFVFEPDNLKFTIKSPAAVVGTVEKLINLGDHLFAIEADDFYKNDSKYGNEGDSKVIGDVVGLLPGKKIIDQVIEE